jgi:surfeit locus 1 family protein
LTITLRGLLAAILVLAAAAVCVRLGFWQLDRLEQRRAYNETLQTAMAQPPLTLDAAAYAAAAADPQVHAYRRVRAVGRYLPEPLMVLRGRSLGGRPGVNAVSALELPDGGLVLVDRGWIPAPDGASAAPAIVRAEGPASVEGILQPMGVGEGAAAPAPVAAEGDTLWSFRALEAREMAARLGAPVLPLYVRLLPDGTEAAEPPLPVPLPELTEGNHLGYAVQWFSFAAIAVGGLLLLLWRGQRTPRRGG